MYPGLFGEDSLMNLTEAQEGVINIAFRLADEEGLLLLDLKDLQSLLANMAKRAEELGGGVDGPAPVPAPPPPRVREWEEPLKAARAALRAGRPSKLTFS